DRNVTGVQTCALPISQATNSSISPAMTRGSTETDCFGNSFFTENTALGFSAVSSGPARGVLQFNIVLILRAALLAEAGIQQLIARRIRAKALKFMSCTLLTSCVCNEHA